MLASVGSTIPRRAEFDSEGNKPYTITDLVTNERCPTVSITKKSGYAISALADLADNDSDKFVSARSIAERQGIPSNLIAQILATLSRAGWVEGVRGPSGGMRLKKDPLMVSLRDVIELFEGPIGIAHCLVSDGECRNQDKCPLHGIWEEAQSRMLEVLEGKTIWDLVLAKRAMRDGER